MLQTVFTIGHSTHTLERFTSLLTLYGVTAVCDVRSRPYSQLNPHFNREELRASLRKFDIRYVFLGKELGARSEDPSCYDEGKIQYDRLSETTLFRQGLERVQEGIKGYRIALMCAEKEPLECHRTILVARHLTVIGLEVQHIHADGNLESHATALSRLAKMLNLQQGDMFQPHEDILDAAYRLQGNRIAYKSSTIVPEGSLTFGSFAR